MFHGIPSDSSPLGYRSRLYFWRPGYPLVTHPVEMKVEPFLGRAVYFVDFSESSVIEFSNCILRPDNGALTRGRIWADMYRLEGDHFVHKGEEFEKWYDTIAAWIRRRYRKIGTKPYIYIGPRAYEWHQAGGQLQP